MSLSDVQRKLITAGYPVTVDGKYGPSTESAMLAALDELIAYQVADPNKPEPPAPGPEPDFNTFIGAAKRIDDIDIPRIGSQIGVGEDELHAVMDVETSGSSFDSQNRPKMLFEPHIFYRELGPGSKRDEAVAKGLAYPNWGEKPYPSDSYPRLKEAQKIDQTAAFRSASWGMGQVMGFNHAVAGYVTPQDMVGAMMDDEENHLQAMVNFIAGNHLDDELRRHDWAGFARGYNGSGYAQNQYDVKLANAYAKWANIPDTPYDPNAPEPAPEPQPEPTPEPEPELVLVNITTPTGCKVEVIVNGEVLTEGEVA